MPKYAPSMEPWRDDLGHVRKSYGKKLLRGAENAWASSELGAFVLFELEGV